jgi:hypothetical protein
MAGKIRNGKMKVHETMIRGRKMFIGWRSPANIQYDTNKVLRRLR